MITDINRAQGDEFDSVIAIVSPFENTGKPNNHNGLAECVTSLSMENMVKRAKVNSLVIQLQCNPLVSDAVRPIQMSGRSGFHYIRPDLA